MYKPRIEQFFFHKEAESGVFGLFEEPGILVSAAKKAKEKKYTNYECYTPYPVHGLDDATGLDRSGIPWITFIMGIVGCTIGYGFQYLTNVHDWQMNIAGKPFHAWPAYIPITFETTVFFAGVSSFAAFLVFSKLGQVFRKPLHPDITSHKFALWIPSNSAGYKELEVIEFLKSLGATDVTVVK